MTTDQSRAELFLTQELRVPDLAEARARLAATDVALALPPEVAGDRLAQLAILTVANIICRLGPYCPSIAISAPDGARVLPGLPLLTPGTLFAPALCQLMTSVQRPDDRSARRYRIADPQQSYQLAFAVGETRLRARRVIYGSYERWTGGFGSAPCSSSYRGPNPFGALLAGALGATAVSRLMLARVAHPEYAPLPLPTAAALSAYSYGRPERPAAEPDLPEIIDLRRTEPVLLVGGGAVASGVAFALAGFGRVAGMVEVADDDALDATNLERHLVSTWADIGAPKAHRLARVFGAGAWNGLRLHSHDARYEMLPPRAWRTVITAVDSPEPRRRLQFDLPQVLLNAGTVGSEFLVSRHDYRVGPCAECLYPERRAAVRSPAESLAGQTGLDVEEILELQTTGAPLAPGQLERIVHRGSLVFPPAALARARREGIRALADAACTTTKVRSSLPIATIGFVAALPGLLLAAELVKNAVLGARAAHRPPLRGERTVFRMDTFGDLADDLEQVRPSRGCRCQDEAMRAAYRKRWGPAAMV
jgi:molybdopterin/thiamine biosynthesis adenylyltransferase